MAYPTPTPACAEASAGRPTLPPAFTEAASRRQAEGEGNRHALRVIPPPSRGRSGRRLGEPLARREGDGESIRVPLVSSAPIYG
ncbi:MAG: hypothetical protein A2V86_17800 [Deltaproteobacteria bacterium RBG_16_49_23]|nr:MAG: hypothetical protein A2V86_17800 [Deltaproteobacteria bacterium RBG_16_49_23]